MNMAVLHLARPTECTHCEFRCIFQPITQVPLLIPILAFHRLPRELSCRIPHGPGGVAQGRHSRRPTVYK